MTERDTHVLWTPAEFVAVAQMIDLLEARRIPSTPIDELFFPDVDRKWSERIYNSNLGD